VRGLRQAEAENTLRNAGFTNIDVLVSDVPDEGVGPNQAIGTNPEANSKAPKDAQITLLMNPPTG